MKPKTAFHRRRKIELHMRKAHLMRSKLQWRQIPTSRRIPPVGRRSPAPQDGGQNSESVREQVAPYNRQTSDLFPQISERHFYFLLPHFYLLLSRPWNRFISTQSMAPFSSSISRSSSALVL